MTHDLVENAISELEEYGIEAEEPAEINYQDGFNFDRAISNEQFLPSATYDPIEDRIEVYLSNARYDAVSEVLENEERVGVLDELLESDNRLNNITHRITQNLENLDIIDDENNLDENKLNGINSHTKGIILREAVYKTVVDEDYDLDSLNNQKEIKCRLEDKFYNRILTDLQHELIHRTQFYTAVPNADNLNNDKRREKRLKTPIGSLGESFAHFWTLYSDGELEDQDIRAQRVETIRNHYPKGDVAAEYLQKLFKTYDTFKDDKSDTELISGIFASQKDEFRNFG